MSDGGDAMGMRHSSASWMRGYVQSPTIFVGGGEEHEPVAPNEEEEDCWDEEAEAGAGGLVEDLGGTSLGDPSNGASGIEGVLDEAFNEEVTEEWARPEEYLPGAPPLELPSEPAVRPGGGGKIVKSRNISFKMVAADHVWSIRQEEENRVVLKVLKTVEDLQIEYAEAISQLRTFMMAANLRESSSSSSSSSSHLTHRSRRSSSNSSSEGNKKRKSPATSFNREPSTRSVDLNLQSPLSVKRQVKVSGIDGAAAATQSERDSSVSLASSSSDSSSVGWIDVQSDDREVLSRLCELFHLHSSTVDSVLDIDTVENVEHYPSLGYFFINIAVPTFLKRGRKKGVDGAQSDGATRAFSRSSTMASNKDGVTSVSCLSCVVFRNLIITIHRNPFPGLLETVREVKSRFGTRHARWEQNRNPHISGNRSVISRSECVYNMMRVGWILTKLVSTVVVNSISDPTSILTKVLELDEAAVFLASQGSVDDQRDVLKNINKFRRTVAQARNAVMSKEQFLRVMLSPACRTTYLTQRTAHAELLKQALAYASRTAHRLESAQDSLASAHDNLMSVLSLNQSNAAHQTDRQVQLLGIVTVISIAPTLIATSMGMNISVPYMAANGHASLAPFFVIVGIIGAWFVLFGLSQLRFKKD